MEHYKVLDIQFTHQGAFHHIYPVVLMNESDIVLIDCGYPGFSERLEAELHAHGISPSDVTKIVLTHQDDDHMGAAGEFVNKYPHIQIAASAIEAPYLSGEEKNLRLRQAEELQETLPEDMQEYGMQFCDRLRQVRPVAVDIELHDGDLFDWGGGCRIISTPGHTPGHISLCLPKEDTVITGDAAVTEGNALVLANPQFCLDTEKANQSLDLLKQMGCKQYICYHGGLFFPQGIRE